MKLYRFSPIQTKEELLQALEYIHVACHQLCKQSFGEYLPVAANIGIFCHYDDEFERLVKFRDELADVNDNWKQKYYRLFEPLTFPAKDGIPAATYTHLYIRFADPYRAQVGDADFVLAAEKYAPLKESLLNGAKVPGARVYTGETKLDMIELYNPDVDALSYVHMHSMEDNVRAQAAGK